MPGIGTMLAPKAAAQRSAASLYSWFVRGELISKRLSGLWLHYKVATLPAILGKHPIRSLVLTPCIPSSIATAKDLFIHPAIGWCIILHGERSPRSSSSLVLGSAGRPICQDIAIYVVGFKAVSAVYTPAEQAK